MATDKLSRLANSCAIRFYTRRHSGHWTADEQVELDRWLSSSPANAAAYDRVARLWADAGSLKRTAFTQRVPPEGRRASLSRPVLAAIVVAVLIVPAWLALRDWRQSDLVAVTTLRGERRQIQLSDGSRLVLDANSEIEMQIDRRTRRIVLRRGEIYVEVAPGSSRRLEVLAGSGRILDIGTRFDVELLHDTVHTTVLDGRIAVGTRRGEVVVEAGRAGGYDVDGTLFAVTEAPRQPTLWQTGQRRFDGASLEDVLERLARYHGVTFQIADESVKTLRVSGTFRMTDLDVILETLAQALPIEVRRLNDGRITVGRSTAQPSHTGSRASDLPADQLPHPK